MKMRNLLLSLAILFAGFAQADQAETQNYKQEFAQLKKNPDLAHLFEKDIYQGAHTIERQVQNYAAIPNKWHRFACGLFLNQDVLVATQSNMPQLYQFVNELAKKADIKIPYIFISIHEGAVNAFAAKFLKGIGGILIDQKALATLTDKQLEAVVAHEMGHIKFEHANKTIVLMVPTFFACLYLSHKTMTFAKSHMPNNKICNWGYWAGSYLRYIGLHEYSIGLLSAGVMTYIAKSLIIGKKFEKQADTFAHEMGHAPGLIEVMEVFEQQSEKSDAQLIAANDKLVNERENLTVDDFNELQQGILGHKIILSFFRWLQAKTPLIPHPSNADRIAAAQAYLDAQVQVPAIEKA
jgi:Zn-dependent protease with chaperone function